LSLPIGANTTRDTPFKITENMTFWFLLLGLFTYVIVRRSVAGITRTPVWLLWLVLMTPALIWSRGLSGMVLTSLCQSLVFGPFVICPVLYCEFSGVVGDQTHLWHKLKPSPRIKIQLRRLGAFTAASDQSKRRNPAAELFPWSVYYIHNVSIALAVISGGS